MLLVASSQSASSEQLVHLFNTISTILIIIGGVLSFAMFTAAAIMFMASGGNAARAEAGMRMAKNTFIGLMILSGGVFFRVVVSRLVSPAGKTASAGQSKPVSPHHGAGISGTLILLIVGSGLGLAAISTAVATVVRKRALAKVTRQTLAAWAEMLEPGDEGPFVPADGFEILCAEKRGELDRDGNPVICFIVAMYRWVDGGWQQLDDEVTVQDLKHTSLLAAKAAAAGDELSKPRFVLRMLGKVKFKSALPSAAELKKLEQGFQLLWPADTAIEELAEQWFDFQERVRSENRLRWAQMADEQVEDQVRKEGLEEQLTVAELLPGPTVYDDTAAALKAKLEAEKKSDKHGAAV